MRTEKMVTRTVTYYSATVMCVNLTSTTIVNAIVNIPELIPEKKRLDYVNSRLEKDNCKAVQITAIEKVEQLYAMSETEFLEHAHKIDKR